MEATSHAFKANVRVALQDDRLRAAFAKAGGGFATNRKLAVDNLPEFEALRSRARDIKEHTLSHLDFYLEEFEQQVNNNGGHVHWASTPDEARDIILDICQKADAKSIIKGKSMVSEEMAINDALEKSGHEVVETDLGEYIIQLANEPPSHIIAPAIHKTREQITELFHQHHQQYGLHEKVTEIADIVGEARKVLREKFISADVGITGANFLVAQTGSNILVTNEGNGDLSSTLPKVHIVTAGIEKVLPTLEDATTILRLLARSATGQHASVYTSVFSGPRREADADGPEEYHVVLLDNGRSNMLAGEYRQMLRCIRCGACMNHCPVYTSIGGHAYGWIYPGPMGSVLTPLIVGLDTTSDLPNACTLNGRCKEVCPMSIPLPDMLRKLRTESFARALTKGRHSMRLWAWLAMRPRVYGVMSDLAGRALSLLAGRKSRFRVLPGASAWTRTRDFPAPQGASFQTQWKRANKQFTAK